MLKLKSPPYLRLTLFHIVQYNGYFVFSCSEQRYFDTYIVIFSLCFIDKKKSIHLSPFEKKFSPVSECRLKTAGQQSA